MSKAPAKAFCVALATCFSLSTFTASSGTDSFSTTGNSTDLLGSGTDSGSSSWIGSLGSVFDPLEGRGTTVFGSDTEFLLASGKLNSADEAEPLARDVIGSTCPLTSSAASNSLFILTMTSSDFSTDFKCPSNVEIYFITSFAFPV